MINTYFGLDQLNTPQALLAATIIGFFFGLVLERAGFGSSKRLSGIFYFKDMTVLKVMFSALVTATLGLYLFEGLGFIDPASSIYHMNTFYYTQILAGLLFGVGFVMGGWCPGTAAVGLASGKIDALLFLTGGILGSIFYNEVFSFIKPLATLGASTQNSLGQEGLAFIYKTLHIPREVFILFLTLAAVFSFMGAEYAEKLHNPPNFLPDHEKRPAVFNTVLITTAILFLIAPGIQTGTPKVNHLTLETNLLESIENAQDHVDPTELADMLLRGEKDTTVIDIRSEMEYNQFHIKGAVHITLSDLPSFMESQKNQQRVVLYSNGMVHPSEARDSLSRLGYTNVYILTDGLTGFIDQCLKPASLRSSPLSQTEISRIASYRNYFQWNQTSTPSQTLHRQGNGIELPEIKTH